jgi:hypothetical protein
VAIVALAALAPACSNDGPGKGEARLEVDGQAVVERDDGDEELVDGSTTVRPGDRVEVTEGVAQMELRGGTRLELRAGIGDAGDTALVMQEVPVLEAGDLLIASSGSTTIDAAGTTVVVDDGAAQVSRALGMGVAAYDAAVQIDSAGQERVVPALREMRVPALGRPPQAPRPLAYDGQDPWDRRFLGAAIDLGERLEALAHGYTQNLREGEGRTPGFFRLVLPDLDAQPEFGAELINLDRPPGDTLVGAAITVLGRRGSFVERWGSVFRFKDEGAQWGLVALDQDVSGTPLLGELEEAVGSSPLAFVEPTTSTSPPPPPSTTTTRGAPPSSGSTTTTTAPSTTAPPTSAPPIEEPLTPVLEPVVEPLTGIVSGLVNGLIGLLSPPPPGG